MPTLVEALISCIQLMVQGIGSRQGNAPSLYLPQAGVPLGDGMYVPLSDPVEVWHFDFLAPPDASDTRHVDFSFTADGNFNAVVFWFDLQLTPDVCISTGPAGLASGRLAKPVKSCAPQACLTLRGTQHSCMP